MDAETLAALERAVAVQAERGHDEPLIRALIKRERSGGERAKVVAWLRGQRDLGEAAAARAGKGGVRERNAAAGVVTIERVIAAIASGAHEEEQP